MAREFSKFNQHNHNHQYFSEKTIYALFLPALQQWSIPLTTSVVYNDFFTSSVCEKWVS